MKNFYEKKMDLFEAKKRRQLGDKAFLKKYIAQFTRWDPANRILLPICCVLFAINTVIYSTLYALNPANNFNLFLTIVWAFCLVTWIFTTIMHYKYLFKIRAARVVKWNSELSAIAATELRDALIASQKLCGTPVLQTEVSGQNACTDSAPCSVITTGSNPDNLGGDLNTDSISSSTNDSISGFISDSTSGSNDDSTPADSN